MNNNTIKEIKIIFFHKSISSIIYKFQTYYEHTILFQLELVVQNHKVNIKKFDKR